MPNKLPKTIALATLVSTISLLLLGNQAKVNAQSSIPLIVAPARQQVNIDPGDSTTLEIKFLNQGQVPLTGNFDAVDFIVTDDQGTPVLIDKDEGLSTRFSGASWVDMPFSKATIAAEDLIRLQYKINVPADARPGGRYVAVYFEPIGTFPTYPGETQEGVLAIAPRIVGLTYIRVNGPISENAIVKELDVPEFVEFGPVPVSAELLNRGDYHITPTGQITLTNWLGRTVDEYVLEEKNIFPDTSRVYMTEFGDKFMIGKYKVDLIAAYGDSGKALSSTAYFWAFPWKIALLILLTIVIITLVVIILWKVLKGKQKELEEKLSDEIKGLEDLKDKYSDNVPSTGTTKKTAKKK